MTLQLNDLPNGAKEKTQLCRNCPVQPLRVAKQSCIVQMRVVTLKNQLRTSIFEALIACGIVEDEPVAAVLTNINDNAL